MIYFSRTFAVNENNTVQWKSIVGGVFVVILKPKLLFPFSLNEKYHNHIITLKFVTDDSQGTPPLLYKDVTTNNTYWNGYIIWELKSTVGSDYD